MSLYFDCAVSGGGGAGNIHVSSTWHPNLPYLAVGSYSEEKGGYVTVYTDTGEKADGINLPAHPTAQVTAVAWHPTKKVLVVGWENGELFLFSDHNNLCIEVPTIHNAAVSLLVWSKGGARLITGDSAGSVVGWAFDRSGQLNTVFHHELKDPISQIIFRNTYERTGELDMSGLARAAVEGDERALDLFSSWRPKTGRRGGYGLEEKKENLNFYVGSMTGVIYYLNENGSCMEVLQADGAIRTLLYHEYGEVLVAVTESLVVGQFRVELDGTLTEISKAKMSTRSTDCAITWAGRGLLGITTGELGVRLWNLDSGDNFVLTGATGAGGKSEFITSLGYCSAKSTLAAGTSLGNILMWKCNNSNTSLSTSQESSWIAEPMARVGFAVKHLSWGSNYNLLGVNCVREVFILREHEVSVHYNQDVCAVQVSPTNLTVMLGEKKASLVSDIQIRGVFVTDETLAVWNGHRVLVYDINHENSRFISQGAFNAECESLVVFEKSIITLEGMKIHIRNFQGTIKQTLGFSENEGMGIYVDVNSSFVVCATITGCIRMWDISRREAKSHSYPKFLAEFISDFGEVISVKINHNATKASILIAQGSLVPDPKLYVWDIENDNIIYFNFASGKNDQDDNNSVPPNSARSDREGGNNPLQTEIYGRVAVNHSWDPEEAKLLIVEARIIPGIEVFKFFLLITHV
ncbi:intraflagellar transport protein 140 homolog [Eurytemora carolleeae]|uniref:intraflagellar transport protein 140 homolog n=1 Tax=Eurytemora carolleeae TaxID=1294199 RepID=UPI000C76BE01|nr:intraflagellar transport protein 140 homolog [Eurytemora carolleeae]|eukprot:XP_023345784.1 intraflagellar transport protein 140 homolog [Eurytemora affinis]